MKLNVSSVTSGNGVIVDSGASVHLFKCESDFISWDTSFNPSNVSIILADGSTCSGIKGKGSVEIEVNDILGKPHTIRLNEVLFYPSCGHTGIISVRRALDDSIEFHFKKENSFMINNEIQIPLINKDQLYHVNSVTSSSLVKRSALEWHEVMGHLNFRDVYRMPKMVNGMSITHKNKRACVTCIKGKSKENKSSDPDRRSDSPFEFVHSDVLGPMNIADSVEEANYLISFVCDFSNFIVVYTMVDKTGVPLALEKFLQFASRFGKTSRIRTDGGPEYTSNVFEEICRRQKIFHEKSPPHTPSMNGTAERSFGTLSPKARCIRIRAALPNTVWPLAYKYAAFLYNRSPVERISSTPFELVYGYPPDVSRIRKFGQAVEVLNHRHMNKLDSRTESAIFMGVDFTTSAYLVWYPDKEIYKAVPHHRVFFLDTQEDDPEKSPAGPVETPADLAPIMENQRSGKTESIVNLNPPSPVVSKSNRNHGRNVYASDNGKRTVKPPQRYGNPIHHDFLGLNYVFNVSVIEYCYNIHKVPRTYNEAMKSEDSDKWTKAMEREYNSLLKHKTFILVDRPKNHDVITGRWVFQLKTDIDPRTHSLINREKARWVARGFLQKFGLNYTDTFAPMSRMPTIRIMMVFCAQYGFLAFQLDVETAYLNAPLDHDIFIEQPAGFAKDKSKVCLLQKSLYGLKQSAKLWNDTIHTFLLGIGFTQSNADLCLYLKHTTEGMLFLIIWVDDIVILSNNINMVNAFKTQISKEYTVKDLGSLKYFLGIEFHMSDTSVQMSQSGYCKTILERFGMMDCKPMKIPCERNIHDELREHINSPLLQDATRYRELVGSLIYLQQVTRPDLSFITNILGQQMSKPTKFHWELGLKTLRYLKGTIEFKLNYNRANNLQLTGYADADWGNAPDRKSQSGYVFYMSANSSPISWSSRKQNLVATSTCDSEYVALSEAVSECLWLQQLIKDINLKGVQSRPANMLCDNTPAISLAANPCYHKKSKHIDIKHHHVRDHISQGTITLNHVPTDENIADGYTKALAYPLFKKFQINCTQPISKNCTHHLNCCLPLSDV